MRRYIKNGVVPCRCFWHTYSYICSTNVAKFRTPVSQGQVTRSRQVTSHHKKSSMLVIATTTLKLSAIDICNPYIQNTRLGISISVTHGQVNIATSPNQWDKTEGRLFWTKTIRNTSKYWLSGRIETLNQNIATNDPSSCRRGHFRFMSRKATSSILAITFDRQARAMKTT